MFQLQSDFLDSIQQTENINSSSLRKLPPIKKGKTAKYLLKLAATWQGNDLETCTYFVFYRRRNCHHL